MTRSPVPAGNWYDGRLDKDRDAATFISARSDSCPIKQDVPNPDMWTTTSQSHFQYRPSVKEGPKKLHMLDPRAISADVLEKCVPAARPRCLISRFCQLATDPFYLSRSRPPVSPPLPARTCGVAATSANGLTGHSNGSVTGWALPPSPICGDGVSRVLHTTTHTAFGGPHSSKPDNRVFESKVDPAEAAARAATRVSYANETNNIVRMNKIKSKEVGVAGSPPLSAVCAGRWPP